MTAPIVVAIDPGPSTSGLVGRFRYQLLATDIIHRGKIDLQEYARRVLYGAVHVADTAIHAYWDHYDGDADVLWAIEAYNTPTPHLGEVAPQQIAETAWLVGWLYAALCEEQTDGPQPTAVERTLLVKPSGHGRQPYGAYPDELVTDGEKRGRNWRLRPAGRSTDISHCRSAWDIADAAARDARTRPRRTA